MDSHNNNNDRHCCHFFGGPLQEIANRLVEVGEANHFGFIEKFFCDPVKMPAPPEWKEHGNGNKIHQYRRQHMEKEGFLKGCWVYGYLGVLVDIDLCVDPEELAKCKQD